MTLSTPNAPSVPVVTAGDGAVTLTWTDPVDTGGQAIIGYVLTPYVNATAQPSLDFESGAQPFTVTITEDGQGSDLKNDTTYTFTVTALTSVGLGIESEHSTPVTPTPAALVILTAEPWEYTTTRLTFSLTSAMTTVIQNAMHDPDVPMVPRIAITRSSFGIPTTPLDGVKVLDMEITEALALPVAFHTNEIDPDQTWQRPTSAAASLYDHRLQPGHWYYYTLFLYKTEKTITSWDDYAHVSVLVPVDYQHREKLWALIPPYYQIKDEEYLVPTTADPEPTGDLRKFINVFGFELDYTRSLAEGVEQIYEPDKANAYFVRLLGEDNLGTILETGLGDIRYRALISVLSRLYAVRGTAIGLRALCETTSKYRTVTMPSLNLHRLADDAEFLNRDAYPFPVSGHFGGKGCGSWAPPLLPLLKGLWTVEGRDLTADQIVGGMNYDKITNFYNDDGDLIQVNAQKDLLPNHFPVASWPSPTYWPNSPSAHKTGGELNYGDYADKHRGLMLCCGAGIAMDVKRYHANQTPRLVLPQTDGIRCEQGQDYTWSIYVERMQIVAGPLGVVNLANVGIGIMWFGPGLDELEDINDEETHPQPFVHDNEDLRFQEGYDTAVLPSFTAMHYLGRKEILYLNDDEIWEDLTHVPLYSRQPSTELGLEAFHDARTDRSGVRYDAATNTLTPMRYSVKSTAPYSDSFDSHVFAVPYITFSRTDNARMMGCAMFSAEINPKDNHLIVDSDIGVRHNVTLPNFTQL